MTLHVIGTFQLRALLIVPPLSRVEDKDEPFRNNPTTVKHVKSSAFVACRGLIRKCP